MYVKGAWVDFSQVTFYSNDVSSSKKSWFQISIKSVKQFRYMKRLRIFNTKVNVDHLLVKVMKYCLHGTEKYCSGVFGSRFEYEQCGVDLFVLKVKIMFFVGFKLF